MFTSEISPRRPVVPWLYRAAHWQIVCLCILAGLVVLALTFGIELWVYTTGKTTIFMAFGSDLFAAVVAGVLQYVTISYGRHRRTMLLHELAVIAEMNHHIRNALAAIEMAASVGGTDQARIAVINESTARITWALQTILGSPQQAQDRRSRKATDL